MSKYRQLIITVKNSAAADKLITMESTKDCICTVLLNKKINKEAFANSLEKINEKIIEKINEYDSIVLIHSSTVVDGTTIDDSSELQQQIQNTIKASFIFFQTGGGKAYHLIGESHHLKPELKANQTELVNEFENVWNELSQQLENIPKKKNHEFLLSCLPVLIDIHGLTYCIDKDINKFEKYLKKVMNLKHWELLKQFEDVKYSSLKEKVQKMAKVEDYKTFKTAFPEGGKDMFTSFKILVDESGIK